MKVKFVFSFVVSADMLHYVCMHMFPIYMMNMSEYKEGTMRSEIPINSINKHTSNIEN